MIFTPRHARAILRGAKTETRRRIRPDEPECRYQPGQAHAIQPGRGEPAIGRLLIVDVYAQRLADMTPADARAEGYDGRDPVTAFIRAWIRTHEPAWRQALDDDLVEPHELRDRWDTHHAPHAVWVVRFELDTTAQPRLLALQSERGYTAQPAQALPEEPEAVDAATQAAISRAASTRDDEIRAARRRATAQDVADQAATLAPILDQLARRAERDGIDVRDDLRMMGHLADRVADKARRAGRLPTADELEVA